MLRGVMHAKDLRAVARGEKIGGERADEPSLENAVAQAFKD